MPRLPASYAVWMGQIEQPSDKQQQYAVDEASLDQKRLKSFMSDHTIAGDSIQEKECLSEHAACACKDTHVS